MALDPVGPHVPEQSIRELPSVAARGPGGRPPPPGPGVGRDRRWRRALRTIALAVAVVVLVALIGTAYVAVRLQSIGRISVAGIRPVGSGAPQTILLAGSDSRAGESAAQASHFGSAAEVSGQRSDVIVLIHLVPATGRASMLSIPRDLLVRLAGTQSSNRINAAFATSPAELVATIEQDFGIVVNHYAQEDFSGLQGITDAVGGVCMSFPYPVRDGSPSGAGNESGLDIPTAGRHVLHGAQALALVRSRFYQYERGGVWHAEGTGDLGRIQRQHSFMRALAAKATHAALHNPFTANAVLSRAVHDVRVDTTYTTIGMLRLGLHLRSLHASAMPSFTLPTRPATDGALGAVLMPVPTQDSATIAAWLAYGSAPATSNGTAPGSPPAAPPAAPLPPWDPTPC